MTGRSAKERGCRRRICPKRERMRVLKARSQTRAHRASARKVSISARSCAGMIVGGETSDGSPAGTLTRLPRAATVFKTANGFEAPHSSSKVPSPFPRATDGQAFTAVPPNVLWPSIAYYLISLSQLAMDNRPLYKSTCQSEITRGCQRCCEARLALALSYFIELSATRWGVQDEQGFGRQCGCFVTREGYRRSLFHRYRCGARPDPETASGNMCVLKRQLRLPC